MGEFKLFWKNRKKLLDNRAVLIYNKILNYNGLIDGNS